MKILNLKKIFNFLFIFLFYSTFFGNLENNDLSSSWFDWQKASGNWGGVRDKLKEDGVVPSANFTTDVNANPVGGEKKNLTYAGFLDLSLALDFEKLINLNGVALTVTNYFASGDNLSNDINNFFGVQEIYAPGNYFFGLIDLSISAFKDKFIFEIGRLFAGDVFAQTELWQYYLSSSVNGNFAALEGNIFFPSFNIASWAARVTYQPDPNLQIALALYNANDKVEETNRNGLYFNLDFNKGYLLFSQLTYKYAQDSLDNGYPGSLSFGGYYESSKFELVDDPSRFKKGNSGIYLIFDQVIFRKDWPEYIGPDHLKSSAPYSKRVKHPYHRQTVIAKDRPTGLTFWLGTYLSGDEKINTQKYQISSGLLYHGIYYKRQQDVLAFCYSYVKFSNKLVDQSSETVLELNYRVQAGPWLYFTPDIQYIIKPNGRSDISNAFVIGFESSINF
jgi:porin